MKERRLRKQVMAWMTLGAFMLQTPLGFVYAAGYPVVPDANVNVNQRPMVMETANGIPLVNVTAPSAGGVSVNNYTDFNVPHSGVVLNNSYTMSNTQLAGMVQGNSHMAHGSAQVILNQVTSANPTHMTGFLEVAGNKASVVVANPNGIQVNGGGFINTNQAILTTGKVNLNRSGIGSIDVNQGKVTIAGDGLNAKGADSLSILTKAAEVNAGVWGKDVALVTGSNTIDGQALLAGHVTEAVKANTNATASASTEVANGKEGVALDVAAVGGMYADRITLIGTDRGLGVNVDGVVAATKAISLDSAGNLVTNNTGSIYSNGDLSVHANSVQVRDEKATLGADGNLAITADTGIDSVGLITSGQETAIKANRLDNHETGRIYGDTVSIEAKDLSNHTNAELEAKLDREMAKMDQARKDLDQAWAVDITKFTAKGQEDAYYANIADKTKAYDAQQAVVNGVVDELNQHKAGTIAGRNHTQITAETVTNRNHGYIYSGGDMELTATQTIHNGSATIEAQGNASLQAPTITNDNLIYASKRVREASITNPTKIRIDQEGHPEQGQAFDRSEFSSLGSGYGAHHNGTPYTAKEEYPLGEYATVRALTADEKAAGYEEPPAELIGQRVPNYEYDDEIFQELKIPSMTSPRPSRPGAEQDAWDAKFQLVLNELNSKLPAYNAKIRSDNAAHASEVAQNSRYEIHNYTIIETHTDPSHKEVSATDAAKVIAGKNVSMTGAVTNTDSRMVAGDTLVAENLTNDSDQQEVRHDVFGTTQQSYTYKRSWPHKSRRRGYRAKVYKTPEYRNDQPSTMGVETVTDHADSSSEATANARTRVQEALDPFGVTSGASQPKVMGTIEGLTLPTASMYSVNPDVTANYLVETDPAFTNKKNFISSDYFFDQMAWDPDHRMKRLGDAYYEQTLISNQVLAQTGKRFLAGYTNNEEEYKALMNAGIAYGKAFNLTPGISLSSEQMEALTTDMVWLEKTTVTVDGKAVEVLYPKVYLANSKGIRLSADGDLISASHIRLVGNQVTNKGTIMATDSLVAQVGTVSNTGSLSAKSVDIRAQDNINSSGTIQGQASVTLTAGQDVNLTSQVDHKQNQDVLGSVANVAVTGNKGILAIKAGQDVNLTGAVLTLAGTDSQVVLEAGHDINLKTQALHSKADMTENANNYIRTERGTELGTDITATGDIAMVAGQDIHVRQGYVASDAGSVGMAANRDVIIEHGDTYAKDQYGLQYKSRGLLSSSKTTIRSATESHGVEGTTISGDSVSIAAGRDTKIKASNVVATQDVTIAANHNVDITSADTTRTHDYYEKTTKSGLMGAGLGIMIGTKSVKDTLDGDYVEQAKSNIGSEQGKVSIQAGDTVHVTSSDIVADTGIAISGQDVTLDAKANKTHEVQTHEEKSSGLTLSLGGVVGNTINAVSQQVAKAKHRDDKRLTALELVEAGQTLDTAVDQAGKNLAIIKNMNALQQDVSQSLASVNAKLSSLTPGSPEYMQTLQEKENLEGLGKDVNKHKRAAQDNLVQINVSLGSQKSKQVFENNTVEYVGGTLASNGTIDIEAKSADDTKGSITAIAETIKGKAVNLSATRDISLEAAENTYDSQYTNSSSGWSVGTSISPVSGMSPNVNVGVNKAKEEGDTHQTIHTGTKVEGAESVTIQSGQDTNIIGSQVQGETVTAKVGKDLTITSLQDVNDYNETSSASGLNLSIGDVTKLGAKGANITGGASYSKGKMDSNYASVTEQAGIYAGTGGFHVETRGTTGLTGAVIASADSITNNTLTTGKLELRNIENNASYSTRGRQVSVESGNSQKSRLQPKLLVDIPIQGNASSVTYSAISDGILSVASNQDLSTVNRNTKQAINKLETIFDKKKIEERQLLTGIIARRGFDLVGDISMKKQQGLLRKAQLAMNAGNNELALKYRKEASKWEESGEYKVALHAVVGGITSTLSGNGFVAGTKAAIVNESLDKTLEKFLKNPEAHKIASAMIGYLVTNAEVGASVSSYGTNFNRYGPQHKFDGEIVLSAKDGKLYQYRNGKLIPIVRIEELREVVVWVEDPNNPGMGWDTRYIVDKDGQLIQASKEKLEGDFSHLTVSEFGTLLYWDADETLHAELGLGPSKSKQSLSLTDYTIEDTISAGVLSGLKKVANGFVDPIKAVYNDPKKVLNDGIVVGKYLVEHPEVLSEIPNAVIEDLYGKYNKLTDPSVSDAEKAEIATQLVGEIASIAVPGGGVRSALMKVAPKAAAVAKRMSNTNVVTQKIIRLVEEEKFTTKLATEKALFDEAEDSVKAKAILIAEKNAKEDVGGTVINHSNPKGSLIKKSSENTTDSTSLDIVTGKTYTDGEQFKDKAKRILKPNITYVSAGYTYKTDSAGRIVEAKGVLRLEKGSRDKRAQLLAGGSDRLPSDHGGHLIASMFGGSGKLDNLVAMDGALNKSAYWSFENTLKNAIKRGDKVKIEVRVQYPVDSNRPSAFHINYSINDKKDTIKFR